MLIKLHSDWNAEWHKKNICEYLKLNSQGFANLKLLSKLLKKQCKNQIFFQNEALYNVSGITQNNPECTRISDTQHKSKSIPSNAI